MAMFTANIQQRIEVSQRNDAMKYSREARNFANTLISIYAKYNSSSNAFELNIFDVPDFHQQEFASILLRNEDVSPSESTSYDNPHYEKEMLPALIRFLANSEKDNEIDFINSWRNGVTNYLKDSMEELINNQLRG